MITLRISDLQSDYRSESDDYNDYNDCNDYKDYNNYNDYRDRDRDIEGNLVNQ